MADPFTDYLASGGKIQSPDGSLLTNDDLQQRSQDPALAATGGMTPHEFAVYHANQALHDQQQAGSRPTMEDYNKSYDEMYKTALDQQNSVRKKISDSQIDLQNKAQEAQIEIQKSAVQKQQDQFMTKALPDAELEKVQNFSVAWDLVDRLQSQWQEAAKNPGFGGNAKALLGQVIRPEATATAVKQYNSALDTGLTTIATVMGGDTAGAAGRMPMQDLMRQSLPNGFDDEQSALSKFDNVRQMLQSRVKAYVNTKAAPNAKGNPIYDTTPIKSVLDPIISYGQKKDPSPTSQPTTQSVFSPQTLSTLKTAASQGTQQPGASPSPLPSPQQ